MRSIAAYAGRFDRYGRLLLRSTGPHGGGVEHAVEDGLEPAGHAGRVGRTTAHADVQHARRVVQAYWLSWVKATDSVAPVAPPANMTPPLAPLAVPDALAESITFPGVPASTLPTVFSPWYPRHQGLSGQAAVAGSPADRRRTHSASSGVTAP